ncbi:MAG: hypothetical protein IMF05_04315 [Proteobacteria bacterium]|nr:hypothetical protein [Pseudomonadota bacterium]MCK4868336.1 hypothetical protein [Alphaproteobacteria bacterium]
MRDTPLPAKLSGASPVYGARPLKRIIQNALQNNLTQMILEGAIADGQTVRVSVGGAGAASSILQRGEYV